MKNDHVMLYFVSLLHPFDPFFAIHIVLRAEVIRDIFCFGSEGDVELFGAFSASPKNRCTHSHLQSRNRTIEVIFCVWYLVQIMEGLPAFSIPMVLSFLNPRDFCRCSCIGKSWAACVHHKLVELKEDSARTRAQVHNYIYLRNPLSYSFLLFDCCCILLLHWDPGSLIKHSW